jgi:anti-anti-sigma factor
MALTTWSETIVIAELNDEPMFSEDMDNLLQQLRTRRDAKEEVPDVIIDLQSVASVNSSNLASLLTARELLEKSEPRHRLIICSVSDGIWTALLATGLDRIFTFSENVTTSLATLQLDL